MLIENLNLILETIHKCQTKTLRLTLDGEVFDDVNDSDMDAILMSIKENTSIVHLNLWCVRLKVFRDHIARILHAVPGNITSLRFISCAVQSDDLEVIYHSLKDKLITCQFELKLNSLNDYQALLKLILDKFVGYRLTLQRLNMPPKVVEQLSEILKNKELLRLDIYENQIGNPIVNIIRHCKARDCFMIDNGVTANIVEQLNEALQNNPYVHQLNLFSRPLVTECETLMNFIDQLRLTRLTFFHLCIDEKSVLYRSLKEFNKNENRSNTLAFDFLKAIGKTCDHLAEENNESLNESVTQLKRCFDNIKQISHKNLDILSDDYYKIMFEYHLVQNEVELAISAFLHIKNKNRRVKDKIELFLNDLMCPISKPMTNIEKRQWQFVLLCALEFKSDPDFTPLKANALSVLLTGSPAPVDDSARYCETVLKTNKLASSILMGIAFLKQEMIAKAETFLRLGVTNIDDFWDDISDPAALNGLLLKRIDVLEHKFDRVLDQLSQTLMGMDVEHSPAENSNVKLGMFGKKR